MEEKSRIRAALDVVDWTFVDYIPNIGHPTIHSVHWYPAPFPPALAGTLVDILGSGGRYLDPYAGSGVGPIEAWLRGYQAFGIDVNTFALELAGAKVELLSQAAATTGARLADEYVAFRHSHTEPAPNLESQHICQNAGFGSDATRWFTAGVLYELSVVKQWIDEGNLASCWRRVLTILVSSMLHRQFSELRDVHYTYIVDRSRTKSPPTGSVDVVRAVDERVRKIFATFEVARRRLSQSGIDVSTFSQPQFIRGDSQSSVAQVGEIDLVITSPPYFGMNDYVRSQYLSSLIFPWESFESDLAQEIGSRRDRRNDARIDHYMSAVQKTFAGVFEVMRPNAYAGVVLGASDSARARGRPILEQLEVSLRDLGFEFVWQGQRRVLYRKINNAPYRQEHIWVLRRR